MLYTQASFHYQGHTRKTTIYSSSPKTTGKLIHFSSGLMVDQAARLCLDGLQKMVHGACQLVVLLSRRIHIRGIRRLMCSISSSPLVSVTHTAIQLIKKNAFLTMTQVPLTTWPFCMLGTPSSLTTKTTVSISQVNPTLASMFHFFLYKFITLIKIRLITQRKFH